MHEVSYKVRARLSTASQREAWELRTANPGVFRFLARREIRTPATPLLRFLSVCLSPSTMSSITSFFSSFIGTVYADAPEDKPEESGELEER